LADADEAQAWRRGEDLFEHEVCLDDEHADIRRRAGRRGCRDLADGWCRSNFSYATSTLTPEADELIA
jgi:hypothetical protein